MIENNAHVKPVLEKANMTVSGGSKHDRKYSNSCISFLHFTQERIAPSISYIVDKKMSMRAASKKESMPLMYNTANHTTLDIYMIGRILYPK
jgi:hypothetical protein